LYIYFKIAIHGTDFVVVEARTETRQRSFDDPQIVAYFMLRTFRLRVTRNGRARL